MENFSALHVAAHAGHHELVEMLLEKYQVSRPTSFTRTQLDINANLIMATE